MSRREELKRNFIKHLVKRYGEYKGLRCAISDGKRDIRWAERDIKELDKKIESLMKEKEWHEERLTNATNRVNVARKRIDELKKAHR